ncbi:MAG TPA: hypothetical protein PKE47_06675 [Verrucomicrobiota bacterium]|nr:hypothetical protein [Verrucomicrobiota bacterium]
MPDGDLPAVPGRVAGQADLHALAQGALAARESEFHRTREELAPQLGGLPPLRVSARRDGPGRATLAMDPGELPAGLRGHYALRFYAFLPDPTGSNRVLRLPLHFPLDQAVRTLETRDQPALNIGAEVVGRPFPGATP